MLDCPSEEIPDTYYTRGGTPLDSDKTVEFDGPSKKVCAIKLFGGRVFLNSKELSSMTGSELCDYLQRVEYQRFTKGKVA